MFTSHRSLLSHATALQNSTWISYCRAQLYCAAARCNRALQFTARAPACIDNQKVVTLHTRQTPNTAGFTLLEVMLAVGILALLTGVMLTLVEKTLEATVTLEQEQQRLQQRQGVLDLLRSTFRALPNDVQFISRRVTDKTGVTQQQLVFANSPTVLAWGSPDELLHSSVILGQQAQTGGGSSLAIKRIPPPDLDVSPDATINYINYIPQEGSSDDTAPWLNLLDNLQSVQWRFFDPRTVNWLDDWTDPNTRPSLVELQWQYVDETAPQRYVFWLPPITPNARPKYNPASSRTSSSTTTQRVTAPAPGGASGR